jgi:hypothetical protein
VAPLEILLPAFLLRVIWIRNLSLSMMFFNIRGAYKIKLKNVNKKRMASARRQIFLEFLKASIADLITLLFSSLQNSEGGGDSDSVDSFADPCQFLPFPKTKIQLSASPPSLLRPLAKNLQKQKSLLGSM